MKGTRITKWLLLALALAAPAQAQIEKLGLRVEGMT